MPPNDEYNKMTVLFTAEAKLVIAFTGLAQSGTFDAGSFIGKALVDVAEPDRALFPMRDRLIEALEEKLRRISLPPSAKRLSLVCTGYQYEEDDPSDDSYTATGILWRISNFQHEQTISDVARDTFEVEEISPRAVDTSHPYGLLTAGATAGLVPEQVAQFEQLLHEHQRRPAKALSRKALEIGIEAARNQRSNNLIGTSWSAAVVSLEPTAPIWVQYYANSPRIEHVEPNFIDASAGDQPVIGLNGMVIETAAPHAFGFPGTPPNAPCPCQSGIKYKRCHGKTSASVGGSFFNRLLAENENYREGLLIRERPDRHHGSPGR